MYVPSKKLKIKIKSHDTQLVLRNFFLLGLYENIQGVFHIVQNYLLITNEHKEIMAI
jgi:hypothetical protein